MDYLELTKGKYFSDGKLFYLNYFAVSPTGKTEAPDTAVGVYVRELTKGKIFPMENYFTLNYFGISRAAKIEAPDTAVGVYLRGKSCRSERFSHGKFFYSQLLCYLSRRKIEAPDTAVGVYVRGRLGNATPLTYGGARQTHTITPSPTPFSKCPSLRLARLPILNSSAKRQY
ncbi:hypothetical protein CEXT_638811 [Caerostris extrusa]|uniref:Uncharacterized protein n=1 Tax=Caerostris extrusa TaxID=172846 RepID=A0AAV4X9M6_CAEEX|nr:hypothetical protein CEXT_638811 [Caerostris extrusa]